MGEKTADEGKKITQEKVLKALDTCYRKALVGIPKTKTCYDLASEYLNKYKDCENVEERNKKAARAFIRWQVTKCTATGFLTGLGGIVTIPVALPADLITVWYIQLRMIATLAVIGGFDPTEDNVQTLAYVCLTGSSASKILKEAGIQFANKAAIAAIKKIPGKVLITINRKVGFRFVTKFGTKGVVNLGKCVPVVGGLVGGGLDFAETKIVASKAYNAFILNKSD